MKVFLLIRKLMIRILHPNRYSSKAFVKHLRNKGCEIGQGTYFFSPLTTEVDVSRPHLLTIGKYCKITSGVHILTHDYSTSVVRLVYKTIITGAKKTEIGDNVFIGIKSIIMPGVKIGNNVIIGSGSVVARDIPDSVIAAGNPAKVITSLDSYFKKIKDRFLLEAVFYAKEFKKATGEYPSMKMMGDFYPLYFRGSINQLNMFGVFPRCNGDDGTDYLLSIEMNIPQFESFSEFIDYCRKDE